METYISKWQERRKDEEKPYSSFLSLFQLYTPKKKDLKKHLLTFPSFIYPSNGIPFRHTPLLILFLYYLDVLLNNRTNRYKKERAIKYIPVIMPKRIGIKLR